MAAATFKTAEGQQTAQLVARSVAFEWCGLDPDADALRQAVALFIYDILLRTDATSDGDSSQALLALLNTLAESVPDTDPIIEVTISRQEKAAEQLAAIACSFLPAPLRSLTAFVKSFIPPKPAPKTASGSTAAPPQVPDSLKQLADQLSVLALPSTRISSRWPTVRDLGEELQKRLGPLGKIQCATVLADVEAWLFAVPLQAAFSFEVATRLTTAFKTLEASGQGIVKSRADLGKTVHANLASTVAWDFLTQHPDMILVAESKAWLQSYPLPLPIETARRTVEAATKDFSFRVLAYSRGYKDGLFVRAASSDSSREDLVVFKGLLSNFGAAVLGLEGKPEVYEVKPITRLPEAVSQVTAYSWNYMIGNAIWKCTKLPGIKNAPGGLDATVNNSVMIPADPDYKTISLPTIALKQIAAAGALGLTATAAQIADAVNQVIQKKIVSGPFVAIPFMVTGLYGVVSYVVIDTGKVSQAVETVIAAALNILIAALLAYLAAKQAAKKLLEEIAAFLKMVAFAIQQLANVIFFLLLALLAAVALALLLIELGPALAGLGGAALVTAGILILIILSQKSQGSGAPPTQTAQASPDTIDVQFGALRVRGITPDQFASWMVEFGTLLEGIWSIETAPGTVSTNPNPLQ